MWCVSGRPLRSSGEGMGRTSLGLCLEMESFSSSRTLSCVLDYCPSRPAPEAAAHCLPHWEGGRASPQDGLSRAQPSLIGKVKS